jgi:hypothetical protein
VGEEEAGVCTFIRCEIPAIVGGIALNSGVENMRPVDDEVKGYKI